MRLFPAVPTPAKGSGGKLLTKRITEHVCRIPSLPHEAPVNAEHISFLPEGNSILVPPCVIHRDPRYFSPSPDAFNP